MEESIVNQIEFFEKILNDIDYAKVGSKHDAAISFFRDLIIGLRKYQDCLNEHPGDKALTSRGYLIPILAKLSKHSMDATYYMTLINQELNIYTPGHDDDYCNRADALLLTLAYVQTCLAKESNPESDLCYDATTVVILKKYQAASDEERTELITKLSTLSSLNVRAMDLRLWIKQTIFEKDLSVIACLEFLSSVVRIGGYLSCLPNKFNGTETFDDILHIIHNYMVEHASSKYLFNLMDRKYVLPNTTSLTLQQAHANDLLKISFTTQGEGVVKQCGKYFKVVNPLSYILQRMLSHYTACGDNERIEIITSSSLPKLSNSFWKEPQRISYYGENIHPKFLNYLDNYFSEHKDPIVIHEYGGGHAFLSKLILDRHADNIHQYHFIELNEDALKAANDKLKEYEKVTTHRYDVSLSDNMSLLKSHSNAPDIIIASGLFTAQVLTKAEAKVGFNNILALAKPGTLILLSGLQASWLNINFFKKRNLQVGAETEFCKSNSICDRGYFYVLEYLGQSTAPTLQSTQTALRREKRRGWIEQSRANRTSSGEDSCSSTSLPVCKFN